MLRTDPINDEVGARAARPLDEYEVATAQPRHNQLRRGLARRHIRDAVGCHTSTRRRIGERLGWCSADHDESCQANRRRGTAALCVKVDRVASELEHLAQDCGFPAKSCFVRDDIQGTSQS